MLRRRRRSGRNYAQAKRPLEKAIQALHIVGPAAAGGSIVLQGVATFPGTTTGFRWEIGLISANVTGEQVLWSITRVRASTASTSVPTLPGAGAQGTFQTPEPEIIAWGVLMAAAGAPMVSKGETKSMRKLQEGDAIRFYYSILTATSTIMGAVQFFVKT